MESHGIMHLCNFVCDEVDVPYSLLAILTNVDLLLSELYIALWKPVLVLGNSC